MTKPAKFRVHTLALIGLMTAILSVLGPLTIPLPFSPIPISLCTLGIYFSAIILKTKDATVSVLLYLLMGFIGLPVFSGFMGGPAKVFGPTGGYLLGYLIMTPVCSMAYTKFNTQFIFRFLGMCLGTGICYVSGTLWLARQISLSLSEAFAMGVLPYLAGDIIKLVIANTAGSKLRKTLIKFNLTS